MKMRLGLSEVLPLEAGQTRETTKTVRVEALHRELPGRLDMRGATADEALGRLEEVLDRMALGGGGRLVVVHGHGTGRLKSVVRDYLSRSGYSVEYKPGEREEGGDGVTIVSLSDRPSPEPPRTRVRP